MSLDAIKTRFIDEIKLRGYDDKYLDKNEEREILQIAIHQGIGIEAARVALAQVCEQEDYVVESGLIRQIQDQCEAATANDGRIDRPLFEQIVAKASTAVRGRKNEREIRRLIVHVMEDHALNKVKTGWLNNWYAAMKRDLGVS
jgi:hypothetical protein